MRHIKTFEGFLLENNFTMTLNAQLTARSLANTHPETRAEKERLIGKLKITQKDDSKWVMSGELNKNATFDVSDKDLLGEYKKNKSKIEQTKKQMEKMGGQENEQLEKTMEMDLMYELYLEYRIADVYHKAKEDESNPTLVKEVEKLLS